MVLPRLEAAAVVPDVDGEVGVAVSETYHRLGAVGVLHQVVHRLLHDQEDVAPKVHRQGEPVHLRGGDDLEGNLLRLEQGDGILAHAQRQVAEDVVRRVHRPDDVVHRLEHVVGAGADGLDHLAGAGGVVELRLEEVAHDGDAAERGADVVVQVRRDAGAQALQPAAVADAAGPDEVADGREEHRHQQEEPHREVPGSADAEAEGGHRLPAVAVDHPGLHAEGVVAVGQRVVAGVVPVAVVRPLPVDALQPVAVRDALVVLQADGGEGEGDEVAVPGQAVAVAALLQRRRVGPSHDGYLRDDHPQPVVSLWRVEAAVHGEEALLVADVGDGVVGQDLVDEASQAVLLVVADDPAAAGAAGHQPVGAVAGSEPDAAVAALGDPGDVVARQSLGGGVEPVVPHPVLVDAQAVGAGVERGEPQVATAVRHQVLYPGGGEGRVGLQRLVPVLQAEGDALLLLRLPAEAEQAEGVVAHPVIAVSVPKDASGTEVHGTGGDDGRLDEPPPVPGVEAVVEAHPQSSAAILLEVEAFHVLQVVFPEVDHLLQAVPADDAVAGHAVEPRVGEEVSRVVPEGDRRQFAAREGGTAELLRPHHVVVDVVEHRPRGEPEAAVAVPFEEGDAAQLPVVVGVGVVAQGVEAADARGGAHPVVLFVVLEEAHGPFGG